jgi:hypothetical protein
MMEVDGIFLNGDWKAVEDEKINLHDVYVYANNNNNNNNNNSSGLIYF